MVGLPATKKLRPLRLADFYLVLARKFHRAFGGFGTPTGEEDGAAGEVWSGKVENLLREGLGGIRNELRTVNELQAVDLTGDGTFDVVITVPDEVDDGAGGEVEVAMIV